ncbi:MAG: ABC transporter permease subunit [Deltaproteobacteria bacterium]|nr:ABC transporter permease subunit [Deltaproteobacteria bacterium]
MTTAFDLGRVGPVASAAKVAMDIVSEITLTWARELRRTLRSGKGLAGLLLFLMGGAGAAIILFSALQRGQFYEGGSESRDRLRRVALEAIYQDVSDKGAVIDYLAKAPEPLLAFYPVCTFFLFVLTVVWGFDAIAADVQYRTIRFVTLRARRPSLVVGRWLAMWSAGALVSLLVSMVLWGGLIANGTFSWDIVLHYGARMWLASCTLSLWYAALTILMSAMVRTPVLALLGTGSVATGLFFLRHLADASWAPSYVRVFRDVVPGAWDDRLLSPLFAHWGVGTAVCLAWTMAALFGASTLLSKRDV